MALGIQATSAVCLERDATAAGTSGRCRVPGAHALAVDFNATSAEGEWYAYGQGAVSRAVAGPSSRVLPDGTRLEAGDVGAGAYLRAGRRGGEPWRLDLAWSYAPPRLELNPLGFQRFQNLHDASVTVRYVRPSGADPFHNYGLSLTGQMQWTAGGMETLRSAELGLDALLERFYLSVHCSLSYAPWFMDVREIKRGRHQAEGLGVPLERAGWIWPSCNVASDPARTFAVSASGYLGWNVAPPPLEQLPFYGASLSGTWRPHPRLETTAGVAYDDQTYSLRYVDGDGEERPLLLGALRVPSLSWTLRQSLVVTPRLTLQLYSQLLVAYGEYGPYFTATRDGISPIRTSDLRPAYPRTDPAFASFADPDSRDTVLVVNLVLRWEYLPGSILYVVYARNQAEPPFSPGSPDSSALVPQRLGAGPTTDSVLLKWSYVFRS